MKPVVVKQMNIKTKYIGALAVLFSVISCSPKVVSTTDSVKKVGTTSEIKNKNIDWEAFDTSSSIPQTNIKIENLQGLWKAYYGIYRFETHINSLQLTDPMIIDVIGETYRRNSAHAYLKFSIKDNLIFQEYENKVDTGIINKISATELTISWKSNLNYTRYYYKK